MARSTRSAATDRFYNHFAPTSTRGLPIYHQAPAAGHDEFDESDVWGSFSPAEEEPAEAPRARSTVPAARPGRKTKPVMAGRGAAHGSLPVAIPDWSKILGGEYQAHQAAGEWELDDADEEDVGVDGANLVPPHELAWRRRAASLSVNDGMGVGRMLKVRDAVWKKTGFQA
jgi:hypothetical protein